MAGSIRCPVSFGSSATLVVAIAALLGAPACSRSAKEADRETIVVADPTIAVRIVNRSQLDAILYLVHDGTRDRLGTVTAASTSSFTVHTRKLGASGEFQLVADPVGSKRATTSELFHTSQGTIFTWTLETDFSKGAVMVQE